MKKRHSNINLFSLFNLFLALIWSSCLVVAQDNYHSITEQNINATYGLNNGEWVMYNSENENQNTTYNYGSIDLIQLTTNNEDFTQVTNILNEVEGGYFYDSGWGAASINNVNQGDICLLVVNMRKTNNVNNLGKVTLGIQARDNSVFEENIVIQLEEQWNQYLVPFTASQSYSPGELIVALGLAWEVQEIEVAGLNILNFRNQYSQDELPFVLNSERYPGYEVDAPWRSSAADRIEANRKSDLDITVSDNNGNPISGADVEIRMLDHEFNWGTAATLSRFAGNQLQNDQYESKLLNLDGEGHRFGWIVPENSFKWPGIEEMWIAPFDQKVNAVNWLKDNGFNLRFHALLWPGWIASPFDIEANANDPQYIIDRSNEWIESILTHPDLQDKFDEFDVINELTTNRDYEGSFAGFGSFVTGREYYIDAINLINDIVPDQPKVINDFVTITSQQYKGTEYDFLQSSLQEIVDGGASIDGIGFQAHIGAYPTSLYEVESILNDFADRFDTSLKITEFDFASGINDDAAASYLEDFLTMIFSIPEVDMFMFWEIWDGAHWRNNAPLFNQDWTPKPAAQVLFDKLFNEWWTEEVSQTSTDGSAAFRGFKGDYEVTVRYQDQILIDTISLSDNSQITVNLDNTTSNSNLNTDTRINIYPNPSSEYLIVNSDEIIQKIELYSVAGELQMKHSNIQSKQARLTLKDLPSGVYVVKLFHDGKVNSRRIISIL